VTAPERPEAVGVVVEDVLEKRIEETADHLLSNAVGDGGNPEWAGFPCVSFRDVDTPQR